MSRQMNDGLDREAGKSLFLWCGRYTSLRHHAAHESGLLLAGI